MLSYPGNALAQSRALNLTLMRTLFIRAGAARYDALSLASGEAMRRRDFVISSAELKISHECRRRKFQPKIKLPRASTWLISRSLNPRSTVSSRRACRPRTFGRCVPDLTRPYRKQPTGEARYADERKLLAGRRYAR